MPLSPRDPNVQGGAIFWDPASKARADRRMRDAEKQAIADKAVKVDKEQIRLNTKLLKEKDRAEKKEKAALRRQEVAQRRAQETLKKDARKAEKARLRALKDVAKVSQLPKQVKSKALKKPQSKVTKRGGDTARRRPPVVHKPSSAPYSVIIRSGRVTRPTEKLS